MDKVVEREPWQELPDEWWRIAELMCNCSARMISGLDGMSVKRIQELTDALLSKNYTRGVLEYEDFNGRGGILVWTGNPVSQKNLVKNLLACGFEKVLDFKSQHIGNRGLVMLVKKGKE